MNKTKRTLIFITHAAVIAALYTVLTLVFKPISFGAIQVRVSEGLCILPLFTPAAIPGLFIGCFISNLIGHAIVLDMVFGSLATLAAATLTWLIGKAIKKTWKIAIAPFPAVILNALIVPFVLYFGYHEEAFSWGETVIATELWAVLGLTALSIFVGQMIACYGIGVPLFFALKGISDHTDIFHRKELPKKSKDGKPQKSGEREKAAAGNGEPEKAVTESGEQE